MRGQVQVTPRASSSCPAACLFMVTVWKKRGTTEDQTSEVGTNTTCVGSRHDVTKTQNTCIVTGT